VAAALHYGMAGTADGSTFMVYDLGGGTFDICLIGMTKDSAEAAAVDGEQCSDESLRDEEAVLQELHTLAEKMKKDLSVAETTRIILRYTGTAAKIT
jgi:molecular chaperone DnaK (HSP70)